MKLKQASNIIVVLATLAALSGCQEKEPSVESKTTSMGEQMQESVSNAAVKTTQYAYDAKDQAVTAFEKALKEMDAKIDALAKMSASYTDEAKAKADHALAELGEQREVAAKKFDELKAASKDAWEEIQAGFDEAWQKLEETYEKVKSEFKS